MHLDEKLNFNYHINEKIAKTKVLDLFVDYQSINQSHVF